MKTIKKVEEKIDCVALTDRYGELDAEINKLSSEKEKIGNRLKALGVGTVLEGKKYVYTVRKRVKKILSAVKVQKLIPKNFLSVVRIVNKLTEKYLTLEQMDTCIEDEKPEIYLSKGKDGGE